MRHALDRRRALSLLAAIPLAACGERRQEPWASGRSKDRLRLVFKHQPLGGDPSVLHGIFRAFERAHGDVEIIAEPLPNDSDVVHQYLLTALEGGSADFDVTIADVVWVPELARAGWIADLSSTFDPASIRADFLAGAAESVLFGGRTFAVPWYVDVGVLYRRTDLVPLAPRTYEAMITAANEARSRGASLTGYVFQGRQYEGLVCNAYEAIWGHGGAAMEGSRVLLDTPEARAGLGYLRELLVRGVSPSSVTSMTEEEARHVFQNERAVFMRNWPYAWAEAQREGSPIRGRVGLSPLPTLSGEAGYGALGGYQLAINAHSPSWKREAALRFIAHMTSAETNVTMALAYGRNPPRRAPYTDPRLTEGARFIAELLPMIERARPRPVTPYYPMITDALQAELSAALVGIRPPAEALRRAQAFVDHLTRGAQ